MSTELNKASKCFIGYIENNPVCFFAVLHFPHSKVRNFKKGHRLVVLPDYQGLGIGHAFSSEIAQMYLDKGFRFIITSSTKSLFTQRARDKRWAVTNKARFTASRLMANTSTKNKMSYSYEYVGLNSKTVIKQRHNG